MPIPDICNQDFGIIGHFFLENSYTKKIHIACREDDFRYPESALCQHRVAKKNCTLPSEILH